MKLNKEFAVLLVGRVAQALLALVAIRLLTELLDKDNIGKTYLITAMVSYFNLIFINPVCMYMYRKLHLWLQENALVDALKTLNLYFLGVSVLSIPIVLICNFYLGVGSDFLSWQMCLLVFLNVFTGNVFLTASSSLNMLERRVTFVVLNLSSQVFGLAMSLLLIMYVEKTAFFWLLGILVGQIFGAISSWICFRKNIQERSEVSVRGSEPLFSRKFYYFCLPVALTTAFMWAQNQSYRLIVETKIGAEALGLLGVGLGVAVSIGGLVESIVTQYFYPQYYSKISNASPQDRVLAWKKLYLSATAVYLPTTLYVIFSASYLLRILVSPKFADSVSLVIMGAIIEFFRITVNIIYVVSHSEMKTRATIFPYIVGAVSVIGGLWLVLGYAQPLELSYVPLVLVGAGVLVFVSMFWSMKKILPISVEVPFIFWCVALSTPFLLMLAFREMASSIVWSIFICGVFGLYLLFAIWVLFKRIGKKTI